ncbi:hypothetical protein M153_672000782 [Pseudoloma neurophilia]|uniref:Uncharacterized protein n=1 Tax=Pseudoloma neurophilia TaxID=146866 RepID=A0A0R0LWD2_9MICR|nr:hypothetical protein M153_672000782 [Pseudoloma neurophilia]
MSNLNNDQIKAKIHDFCLVLNEKCGNKTVVQWTCPIMIYFEIFSPQKNVNDKQRAIR